MWTAAVLLSTGLAFTPPLSPGDVCGAGRTCQQTIDEWNDATWDDLVDASFSPTPIAAVRWYTSEFGGVLNSSCGTSETPDEMEHRFCGVTDELSNVLLNHAVGSDQNRYQLLHNFTELLRHPDINSLQCWKWRVDGEGIYDSHDDLCVETDSASDASIRILGAYAVACAKQRRGEWSDLGADYCSDYEQQGWAIWGIGTASHGEVKTLTNGELFLANGYNNQAGAPTAADSIRPDYYELQFLMDFAEYVNSGTLATGVMQMLRHYSRTLGDNQIHRGKTGHFDSEATTYTCDQLCSPPYMDNVDTWRAVPALSGLLAVHSAEIPIDLREAVFDEWWNRYSGGNPSYQVLDPKPFEIFANSADGVVKQEEHSYKTLAMWIPLAVHYDATYTSEAVEELIAGRYDAVNRHFFGADHYGGYFSQFAQRALAIATGLLDPRSGDAPLDIDGNRKTEALTDGILILRYLFGFSGEVLTTGAVGYDCTRCDAAAILPHLQSLDL